MSLPTTAFGLHQCLQNLTITTQSMNNDPKTDVRATVETNEKHFIQVSIEDLEAWKKRVVYDVESYYSEQQLQRIAEFGRAHANLIKEAQQYVDCMRHTMAKQAEDHTHLVTGQLEEENQSLNEEVHRLREEISCLKQDLESSKHIERFSLLTTNTQKPNEISPSRKPILISSHYPSWKHLDHRKEAIKYFVDSSTFPSQLSESL